MDDVVAIDAGGRLVPTPAACDRDDVALATECVALVGRALDVSFHLVTARVGAVGADRVALVTVRQGSGADAGFSGGSRVARDRVEAVVRAAADALGVAGGVLGHLAARWQGRPGLEATSIVCAAPPAADGAAAPRPHHAGLAALVPSAGRLTVTTERSTHEVLALGAETLVVSSARGSVAAAEVARALDRLDAIAAGATM